MIQLPNHLARWLESFFGYRFATIHGQTFWKDPDARPLACAVAHWKNFFMKKFMHTCKKNLTAILYIVSISYNFREILEPRNQKIVNFGQVFEKLTGPPRKCWKIWSFGTAQTNKRTLFGAFGKFSCAVARVCLRGCAVAKKLPRARPVRRPPSAHVWSGKFCRADYRIASVQYMELNNTLKYYRDFGRTTAFVQFIAPCRV